MKKYKRWNGKQKPELAIAQLTGESLEEVSRSTGQSAHVFNAWKEAFLGGDAAALSPATTAGRW